MRKSLSLLLLLMPLVSQGADLANGERINRSCSLCHGIYGQGASGRLSPRLAGLPQEYLVKATKDYLNGKRNNPLMVSTTGLDKMSDQDIEDVAAYLSSIDFSYDRRFDVVQRFGGSVDNGKEIYGDECDTCHAKNGAGKPKKEAPPLRGQHSEYLFQSMKMFQNQVRIHDNDPEDDTFNEYSDTEIMDLTAYLATLDNALLVDGKRFVPPRPMMAAVSPQPKVQKKHHGGLRITDITQTVAQMPLKAGVTKEDAIEAMLSKAVELNLKLVGRQDVSKELEARGVETPYLSIFQFCNPMDARVMVISNPIFSSYMPCRISLVEDQNGQLQLMMLNLDMLINSELLPGEVLDTAIRVNQSMLDVMMAGASGEF
ncbi:MAG: c-type cytochrome [Chromatiales bacterium]|nr:c-type cytochrome [Chromatiales bacterium]